MARSLLVYVMFVLLHFVPNSVIIGCRLHRGTEPGKVPVTTPSRRLSCCFHRNLRVSVACLPLPVRLLSCRVCQGSASRMAISRLTRNAWICANTLSETRNYHTSRPVQRLNRCLNKIQLLTEQPSAKCFLRGAASGPFTHAIKDGGSRSAGSSTPVSPIFLSRLSQLRRPLARKLLPQLSFGNPLMLPESMTMTPLLQFVEQQKLLRKDSLILTQVGDFFEAYGVDAVMLVEFCGLNPMGGKPKAGCPKGSVQGILDCLTNEGFSVSVYEEVPSPSGASSGASLLRNRKLRVLTQVVSPASPLYLPSNLPLFEGDIGANTSDSLPIFSLYFSPSLGFCCGEVHVQERRMRVECGLTAEGARTRIEAATAGMRSCVMGNGVKLPGEVYIHCMTQGNSGQTALEMAREMLPSLMKRVIRSDATAGEFHQAVLREISASLNLSPGEFTLAGSWRSENNGRQTKCSPHPLHTATASQLGLLSCVAHHSHSVASSSASLVPPLHKAILPAGSPATAAKYLQRLLLLPPPSDVADAIQEALRKLVLLSPAENSPGTQQSVRGPASEVKVQTGDVGESNPSELDGLLIPSGKIPNVGKVVQLIGSLSANRQLFLDILSLLQPTAYCLEKYPPSLLQPLFTILRHETQQAVEKRAMEESVCKAATAILQVVHMESEVHERAADAVALAAAEAAEAAEAAGTVDESFSIGAKKRDSTCAVVAETAAERARNSCRLASEACAIAASSAMHGEATSTCGIIPAIDDFFQRTESFRGHVQPHLVLQRIVEVALAADSLLQVILRDFSGIELQHLPALQREAAFVDALEQSNVCDAVSAPEVLRRYISSGQTSESLSKKRVGSAICDSVKGVSHMGLEHHQSQLILDTVIELRRQRITQLQQLQQKEPRLFALLNRYLASDSLNNIVYLKKHKPPLMLPQSRAASKISEMRGGPLVKSTPADECLTKLTNKDSQAQEVHHENGPEHPRDRNHRIMTGNWTTPEVSAAVKRYANACVKATAAVKFEIQELSHCLQPLLPAIVHAAHFSTILQGLSEHALFACSNGWSLPRLRCDGKMQLRVRDMTPYYLPRNSHIRAVTSGTCDPLASTPRTNKPTPSPPVTESSSFTSTGIAVHPKAFKRVNLSLELPVTSLNEQGVGPDFDLSGKCGEVSSFSFDLDGIFLLTGENMAGKSTFCRSTLALVLLANAGLFCPCSPETVVPRYSSFLSSAYVSHDSPLERKSYFLHEAQQLRAVYDQTLASTRCCAPKTETRHSSIQDDRCSSMSHFQQLDTGTYSESGKSNLGKERGIGHSTRVPKGNAFQEGDHMETNNQLAIHPRATSFFILDEPCKGTAPKCGAALLGSLLESLGAVRGQGIVSTHLHHELQMLPLELEKGSVSFKQMIIVNPNRQLLCGDAVVESTDASRDSGKYQGSIEEDEQTGWYLTPCKEGIGWRYLLSDGVCDDSNALKAALTAGLPTSVVKRAKNLEACISWATHSNRENFAVTRSSKGKWHLSEEKDSIYLKRPQCLELGSATPTEHKTYINQKHALPSGVLERAKAAYSLQKKLLHIKEILTLTARDIWNLRREDPLGPGGSSVSRKIEILILPPPPQKLSPPPSWLGAACVYVLLSPVRTSSHSPSDAAQNTLASREQDMLRLEADTEDTGIMSSAVTDAAEKGATGPEDLQCTVRPVRVYVGETEDIKGRLTRHRQSPLWAHASVLVLRTKNKAEARLVETKLIRTLRGDPGICLESIKDGNRKPRTECIQQIIGGSDVLAAGKGNPSAPCLGSGSETACSTP